MLKQNNFRKHYDSSEHDILNDFYIKALKSCNRYSRMVSFFSSSALRLAVPGFQKFVENGGKMRLMVAKFISADDAMAITQPERYIKKEFANLLEISADQSSTELLAWLIKHNHLEVKVVLSKTKDPRLFHQKIGIFSDSKGSAISFSGSENETAAAWRKNIEEFKVFKNWEPDQIEYFKSDHQKFEKYWNNDSATVRTINATEALKEAVEPYISTPNASLQEIKDDENSEPSDKNIVLRPYQEEAINAWCREQQGTIQMATGCGKTFIGLYLAKKLETPYTVVATPTRSLAKQWKKDILENPQFQNLPYKSTPMVITVPPEWNTLKDILNLEVRDQVYILTTHRSLSKTIKLLKHKEALLIGDEVHGLGAEGFQEKCISVDTHLKLGLSATPKRLFDEEGNDFLNMFFGEQVFEYSLGEAISEGYLSPYEYYTVEAQLSKKENKKYRKLTQRLAILENKENPDKKAIKEVLIQRARIPKNAKAKPPIVRKIICQLSEKNSLTHTLIFCADKKQLVSITKELRKYNITSLAQITKDTTQQMREKILKDFASGRTKIIISIDVLTEGISVNKAKNAILASNTSNPREYIQRRGRVLRKSENKIAQVFDILICNTNGSVLKKEAEREQIISQEALDTVTLNL